MVVALFTSSTQAASPEDEITAAIEAKAAEAAGHFAAKDFAKAVRAYIEAYQIARRPSELLYNIAFIYDAKLEQRDMAASYYKKYAQATDADPALLEKAIRRMGELRKMNDRPPVKKPPVKDPETVASVSTTKKNGDDPGASQKLAGVATIVTGGVVIVAAAGLYIGALLNNNDFAKTTATSERISLADQGKTFALAGDIMMGVGGALALVGIILLATAPDKAATSGKVNVGATVWRGGAGLVLSGSL